MIAFGLVDQLQDDVNYRLSKIQQLVEAGLVDPELGTLSVQSRLLTEHAMRLTPPQNKNQGERRVGLDIERIFHPIDYQKIKNRDIATAVKLGSRSDWDAFARNIRSGPFAQTKAVTPTKDLHAHNRNNRGRGVRTKMVTLTPEIDILKKLIEEKKKMVGWARAGWLPAYLYLQGTRAPSWVTRHSPGSGTYTDGRRIPQNPFISGYNTTGWAMRNEEAERIMQNALKARSAAMKTFYEKTMEVAKSGQLTQWQTKMRALVAAE